MRPLIALTCPFIAGAALLALPASSVGQAPRTRTPAEEAYQQGDFDGAIKAADQALRTNPSDHVALYLRASSRVEKGLQTRNGQLLRDGIADAREAIRLGGKENVVYYLPYLYGMTSLSIVENRKDHADTSVKVADEAINKSGLKPVDKAKLLYQRGLAKGFLAVSGPDAARVDDAVRDYQEAIRLDPQLVAAYTNSADLLAKAGRTDDAKAAFDRTVKAFPNDPLVYNNRGMFFQQSNQPEKAVADYSRAIELDPNYFYAYTNRGVALLQTEDAQAAENDFTASLRLNPSQPMVYGLRGTARTAQGKFDQAITDHLKALEMVPNNPTALTDLGFAQFFAGKYEEAARSFEKAMELSPSFIQLNPWRVAALEELGRKDAAETEFAASFEKPADRRNWIENLVAFQYDRINTDQLLAAVAADEPLKTAQQAEAEYFIGRKLEQQGQAAEARQAFERTVETGAKHLSAYRGAKFELSRR